MLRATVVFACLIWQTVQVESKTAWIADRFLRRQSQHVEIGSRLKSLATYLLAFHPAATTASRSLTVSAQAARYSGVRMQGGSAIDLPRKYAPVGVFRTNETDIGDPALIRQRIDEAFAREKLRRSQFNYQGATWGSAAYRIGLISSTYVLYPLLAELLAFLPRVESPAGSNFFGLVAIVLGTLIAATVSDSTARQANLRSAVVDEVTMLLVLVRQLETELSGNSGCKEEATLLRDCFRYIWGHTTMLITGSRGDELKSIADGSDCPAKLLATLQSARAKHGEKISTARANSQRVLEIRGRRLSLENAGTPNLQLNYLRVNSIAISLIFAYLTLDYSSFKLDLALWTDPLWLLTVAFGPRSLLAYLVATLEFATDLCEDLNQPFQGYFRIDSGTLWATMVQVRELMAAHLGRKPDEGLSI